MYVIPLSPLARRVLAPLLAGDADLLFPSRIKDGAPASIGTQFQRKVRAASGVADWFPHAHRDTITTWLQGKGYDLYDRGLVLNHSGSGTVTGGYSHGFSLDRTRALLDEWADHVSGVVAAKGVELIA